MIVGFCHSPQIRERPQSAASRRSYPQIEGLLTGNYLAMAREYLYFGICWLC